ncbi:GspH/FimT family pseudopilin [Pseudomonas sp. CCOS 191]|uniref:GspH/FimT family pseudopilin n=1 Tax=Pseudomonas sp. CCOS 191 TaxID=1649877 RepID=UPI000624C258|nr:GspH/FimT family protein [Pseudomonas sp. CCOS 191]CRI55357.1 type IV pili biogenesis protein FimT [Pseudomonas sp. CCOS 191]
MRQQDVTLLQMMCALTIGSLLAHLGITAYAKLGETLQLAAAARELAQALRAARNQAALHQLALTVRPLEGDWGKGWRVSREHDGQLLREHRLARPVKVVASSTREVRFSKRGAPIGEGFVGITLDICQRSGPGSQHQVVLSPSGRVSLRSDEGRRCAGD